jgi:iron complex transport system substrate-binding protein
VPDCNGHPPPRPPAIRPRLVRPCHRRYCRTPPCPIDAIRAGRAHGLWNYFSGTAINVVGAEVMARWVRPDLDPAATLAEINRRFAAVPFEGTYWTSLNPADDAPAR